MDKPAESTTFSFEDHKQWHRDHHQGLIEVLHDFTRVVGREPLSILELFGWSHLQCTNPNNPRPKPAIPNSEPAQPAIQ